MNVVGALARTVVKRIDSEGPSVDVSGIQKLLEEPMAAAIDSARSLNIFEIDNASLMLKQFSMDNAKAAQVSMEQMIADPSQVMPRDKPFGPLQNEWLASAQRSALAMCAAGALDGVLAYVCGLGPRAFRQDPKAPDLGAVHELARWAVDYANEAGQKGNASELKAGNGERQQRELGYIAENVPVRTGRGDLMGGGLEESLRLVYDYGLKVGIAEAALAEG